MMMRRACAALALLVLLPGVALANAGTPLMWAGLFHLAIGNLVLGVIEGRLLAWVFRVKPGRAIAFMILANYFSATVGGLVMSGVSARRLPLDLYDVWPFLWAMIGIMYVVTLLLEWPAIAFILRKRPDWLRASILGSLLVQTVTYAILVGWYWLPSGKTLLTEMRIVQASEMSLPQDVVLYYIAAEDGSVRRRSLADSAEEIVYDLKSRDRNDRLFLRRTENGTDGQWDLVTRLETDDRRHPELAVVQEALEGSAAMDERPSFSDRPEQESTWFGFGPVPRLGAAANSPWEFRTGFWSIEGLTGENTATGARVWLSFETPFVAWMVRNAEQLPGDDVLFQLGDDQICVLEPASRKVALIARGRGPVALLTASETEAASALPGPGGAAAMARSSALAGCEAPPCPLNSVRFPWRTQIPAALRR